MKTLLSTVAFAALLAGTPAFAANDPAAAPAATAPSTMDNNVIKPVDPNAAPDTSAQAPVDNTDQNAQAPAVNPPAAASGWVASQAADDKLASNWIGTTVYSPANESVGDINDLVIDKDGKVSAIVVGVGGFLGIGEKNVAVPFSAVTATADQNGKLKLTIQADKAALEAAPEFKTLAALNASRPATQDPMNPAPTQ